MLFLSFIPHPRVAFLFNLNVHALLAGFAQEIALQYSYRHTYRFAILDDVFLITLALVYAPSLLPKIDTTLKGPHGIQLLPLNKQLRFLLFRP